MPTKKIDVTPSFQEAFNRTQGYVLATPYGTVSITEDGRRITFQLYEDVRSSIHHKALFSYYQTLNILGNTIINCDHLDLPGLDSSLDLRRGRARLDLVYMRHGKIHEVELKTHREIGLDVTANQLHELAKHCENLIVVVPRRDMIEMARVIDVIGLTGQITVDSYEMYDEDDY